MERGAGSKSGKAGHGDTIKAVTIVYISYVIYRKYFFGDRSSTVTTRPGSLVHLITWRNLKHKTVSRERERERKICAVPTVEVLMKCFGHVCNAMLCFSYDTMKIHFQMNRDFDV